MQTEHPICQIALSVRDRARSSAWYEALFGLEPTGEMGPVRDPEPARLLELDEIDVSIGWLAARDPMSQFELIEFTRPAPRPLPPDCGPRYAGYGVVGIVVSEFENTLHALRAAGSEPELTGTAGARSMWVRDPDGIPLEIMERDPLGLHRGGGVASLRSITLTVADLGKAHSYWTNAVGLSARPRDSLHFNPFPASLIAATAFDEAVVRGGSLLVRLLSPRRTAPLPRADNYRLSDAGVLNIAVILDSAQAFANLHARVRALGYPFSVGQPMAIGDDAATIYGHDDQGNSVEMGFVLPGRELKYGWKP